MPEKRCETCNASKYQAEGCSRVKCEMRIYLTASPKQEGHVISVIYGGSLGKRPKLSDEEVE